MGGLVTLYSILILYYYQVFTATIYQLKVTISVREPVKTYFIFFKSVENDLLHEFHTIPTQHSDNCFTSSILYLPSILITVFFPWLILLNENIFIDGGPK